MRIGFKPQEPLALTNPNRAWVVNELDKLLDEWRTWLKHAASLPDSADYNPNTTAEALKDGRDNLRKHEIIRERTLIFIANNFSGIEFMFRNWPSPPHEDNLSRLRSRIPGWVHRLEMLRDLIQYARVPDSFWKQKGKELVAEIAKAPDKAVDVAASWLKNPFASGK